MIQRTRCRGARTWLLLGSTLISLAGAELVLRSMGVPREEIASNFLREAGGANAQPDADVFWRLASNSPGLVVNRLHLRGFAPGELKGDRSLRIVCIGDSCTFGANVAYEESYPIQLEQALQQQLPHANVETLIAAVPGYSTYQNRRLVELDVVRLRPDIWILYCGAGAGVSQTDSPDGKRARRWGSICEC
ncbi:MAG: GDSL-type esterase/lipase family protein [Planctomycetota bacterium]